MKWEIFIIFATFFLFINCDILQNVILLVSGSIPFPDLDSNFISKKNFSQPSGDLSEIGYRSAFILGRYFNEKYAFLFDSPFNYSLLQSRSINEKSVLQTMHAILLGLVNENEEQLNAAEYSNRNCLLPPWNTSINKKIFDDLGYKSDPFDIYIPNLFSKNESTNETSINFGKVCPRFENEVINNLKSKEYLSILNKYNDTLQSLCKMLNIDCVKLMNDTIQMQQFFTYLIIEDMLGQRETNLTNQAIQNISLLLNETNIFKFTNTNVTKMIGLYGISNEIHNFYNNFYNFPHEFSPKMILLGSEDALLITFLSGINVTFSSPPFSSHISIELWANSSQPDKNSDNIIINHNGEQLIKLNYTSFSNFLESNTEKIKNYTDYCRINSNNK